MGEGLGGHITRGLTNQKVDLVVNAKNGGQFHQRQAFLDAVKGAADAQAYLVVLKAHAKISDGEFTYLRDNWYDEGPQGFWSWLQPIYPILKQGLVKAIEAAGQTLPMVTLWAPVGSQVEVVVHKSESQVSRIVLTPPTPFPATMNRTRRTDLWVVRRGSEHETRGRETFEAIVEDVDAVHKGVVTWQIKELWVPPPGPV